jgi:hypothetical protein
MSNQTFSIKSSEKGEGVTIHFVIEDGRLAKIFGTDEDGNDYNVGIRLTRSGANTNGQNSNTAMAAAVSLDGGGFCCCFDPGTGEMVCTQTNGPCPDCP